MARASAGKGDGWKKAGLIGLGTVLGILLSLNFSAVAQREATTADSRTRTCSSCPPYSARSRATTSRRCPTTS